MSVPVDENLDFKKNHVRNFAHDDQSSAPSNPTFGQEYINSTTGIKSYWNGSKWVDASDMATDEQASTGTAQNVTINPKQLKAGLDTKQDTLNYTPENIANKVTSISSGSTDTQYPSAKLLWDLLQTYAKIASPVFTGIPTAPTATAGDSSYQIANTSFVMTAIDAATAGTFRYIAPWDTSNATDFSALNSYRPIKAGWTFRCTGTGCTIDSVDYKAGDVIIFNRDVSASTTITTVAVDKYDHTQDEDTVLLSAVQTLTNKTINASNNTISNLALSMFAAGVVATSMGSTPSDAKVLTEKAISNLLVLKAPLASPAFTGTPTVPTQVTSDNSTKAASTAFVKNAIASQTQGVAKIEDYNNPSLTPTDGKCTWTVTHTLGTDNVVATVYEVSTGKECPFMDKRKTSSTTFTIRFNSATEVAANTYQVILTGVVTANG